MVTAELAVALPAVTLVLVVCAAGLMAGVDQIRCVDAARLAGRAAARGDPVEEARRLALTAAPAGAEIDLVTAGDEVHVVVRARSGEWGIVPGWTVSASAITPVEIPSPP
ncbi:hypothetical protein N865_09460 [Intrasporangium oryzae NRRL B-24470]|uniref:Pilus assembly protein TadE n=1 Tax=Intrasporangium oryzae NRRL B-24470 TaxID=1386089 RepID=W9GBS6_9MICO|nr:TadE family type IV pilus minor pilin [Intrasporangium oryzae]EWT03661.1 hypothetical protein N865_09460 [Intrasporangium oryzae NRRL B-24470]